MDKHYTVTDMIVILLNKIHRKNSSLRLALSLQRKKYFPNDKVFWSEVYTTIMDIEKYYITISKIEKFVFPKRNFSSIRSYLDLVSYWKFWEMKSSERIKLEGKKFFFSNNKNKRTFHSFLESIEEISLKSISATFTDPAEIWSFKFSLPALMYSLLQPFYSVKELNLLGNWFNSASPTYIWINNQQDEFDVVLESIKSETTLIPVSSVKKSFIVGKGRPIQSLVDFKEGKILIQNLGATIVAQLVPQLTGPATIIDLCASPGNKTIQLFDKFSDGCTLLAGDIPGPRFKTLTDRVPTLLHAKDSFEPIPNTVGIQLIQKSKILQLRSWDGTNLPFEQNFADLIFIDAPCTGSGTMNSKLDVRQLLDHEFLVKHLEIQQNLLQEADRILKSKGFIFYTTCSLLPDENETQITNFLENNSNYSIIDLNHPLNSSSLLLSGSIKLFPPQSKTEGFFAILLQKK